MTYTDKSKMIRLFVSKVRDKLIARSEGAKSAYLSAYSEHSVNFFHMSSGVCVLSFNDATTNTVVG